MNAEIKKYLEESLQHKKGLTFYVNGNTVNGESGIRYNGMMNDE